MVNSVTGDGSYSPNIIAGIGDTGTVSIDTGPLDANYLTAGIAMAPGNGDGTITITGDNGVVNVADPGIYAYSRLLIGSGDGPYTGTGVLNVNNGGSLTSTNNASIASGSIPLGGYSNLVVGSGPGSMGTVNVDGVGTFGSSVLGLYGGSAGFILGADSGNGSINVTNGGQFFTLTGVIGAGDSTGGVYPGGTGAISVTGNGSTFIATTNNGNFLIESDQAPVIIVGQNDGVGFFDIDSNGAARIENLPGDGTSSPTLIFGDDLASTGTGNVNNSATLNIVQYGPAATGNRLNGNSGLIVGNAGVGDLTSDGDGIINVLGDRANLVVSRGSYDGQGAPIAPLGRSQLTLYYAAVATIDSQGYSGVNGSQATVGERRLSDGRILVSQAASLNVVSSTDVVGDYLTGRIVVGDLGNGILSAGRRGYVNASELIIGGRGYLANPLDNSTDLTFTGYNAAPDGGGTGLLELTAGNAQIIITATDATPDRGITLGQASGTAGTLTIQNPNTGVSTGSYVKSTGGLGSIIIGEYGAGTATITGGGALYGGFITVGLGTTAAANTLTISGAGSKTVASGVYSNVLFGGLNNGQSAVVEIARQDGAYGRLVINSGGELQITNDAGNDQNPTLLVATEDSYGRVEVDGAGSAINITQNGARFLAPSGDTFGGAEAIIGKVGYARVDLTDQAEINIVGDSAMLSVGDGGYDAVGDPIISSAQSNLTISGGSTVLVDSQTYGFDDTASGYSTGASVYIGRGIGGYGRITVAGTPGGYDSSLTVTSSSDFVNDYVTGGIVVGDLGMGELAVQGAASGFGDSTTVTARSLTVGQSSFYDDGSGRQYGGYLPVVTAAGTGAVTLTGNSNVVLTATENTPDRGLTIGRDSGTVGTVSLGTYGSITSQGGEGKIVVGEFGDGTLTLNDGAGVTGFSMEIGIGEGSNGDVVVDGYDMLAGAFSQITLSNQFGDFSGDPEDNGQAGNLRIGVEDGSNGSLTINGGGIVNVINQSGTTYDAPTVQLGSDNGAVGTLTVDGYYGGSFFYPSQLSITKTGNVGDFVATGGVGPIGAQLIVGQGGQGLATASNQGQIVISGAGARLFVAAGGTDAAGNPDTTTDRSDLEIRSGAIVTVDSQSYGGTQTFTDPMGNPVTASLGAQVVVGGGAGATGLITLDDAGSALLVTSADESAGDYETGRITFGRDGGTGSLLALSNSTVQARGLSLGIGENSVGSATLFGGDVIITGTDVTRYQGVQIGRDGGVATVTVRSVSELTSTGGAGRLQVGREADGQLNINTGGTVNAFFMDVGRGAGSNGGVDLDGYGSRLTLSDAFGQFDPAVTLGPRGGNLTVGREDGGNGDITVSNGASLNVINDDMTVPPVQGNGATLTIGRDTGALGEVTVTGDDGMGNASYLRVQNYGRSNDGVTTGEYYGPELRLGRDGGDGQLTVELGAYVDVIGEAARVIIGEGTEGGDYNAEPTSLVQVTSGGTLFVDSIPNPDGSLPYNAAANIIIGQETGGNGRLLVTGSGSSVTVQSDNASDYYDVGGGIAFGAGLTVGQLGNGVLDVEAGGQITIDGTDDVFPNLSIGYGSDIAATSATGAVTVTGAGSLIEILGSNAFLGGVLTNGAGGLIEVGVNDGTTGSLTISDGGSVQNSSIRAKTEIARDIGSTGDVTVTGAGSNFYAGIFLAVGAYESGNSLLTDQSGTGSLTINDQAVVSATSTIIGDDAILSISDATLTSTLDVSGRFFVGGVNSQGDATVTGAITQFSGLLEFDVFGANAGEFDTLTSMGAANLSGDAITIDVGNLATLNVGDSAVLFSTTGTITIDTTETVTFVGQAAGPGREFVLTQEFDPMGQAGPSDQLVFSVAQATLASVTGDLEIISPADGQVALTSADISVFEGGVDPALQTLTATNVIGGQLESALDPSVALTSFSQQDVDDRLIRFVSDGSSGGSFDLGFTDSSGFADSVSVNVAPVGVPDVNLGDLNGINGVTLNGILADDQAGLGVSDIGDINNDGIADIAVGASFADTPAGTDSGEGYIIFGVDGGLPSSFELSSLDGTNGFTFTGLGPSQLAGANGSVEGVGDVNNDGIDDFIIGIGGVDTGGVFNVGEAFLIYGNASGFGANFDLGNLDGTNGTRLVGIDFNSLTGQQVPGLGDVNGDGINDFGISASFGDGAAGTDSGESFVVFGVDGGLGATLQLSDLDGTNGFRLEGDAPSDNGGSIGRIGDFNNDGIDDFLVGAPNNDNANGTNTGNVQIIFGTTANQAAVRQLNSITAAEGFRILGLAANDSLGGSVSDGGDVNGDGIDDLIITSKTADVGGVVDVGTTYVIFGTTDDFAGSFDLATLDGTNGFSVSGSVAGQRAGYTSASAGDVNGDGVEDLIIGAIGTAPGGEVYVIFGSTDPFAATVDLESLTGETGFTITAADPADSLGRDVSTAGDFNNDGITDILVGANTGDPGGRTNAGEAFVVYGVVGLVAEAPTIAGDLQIEAAQGQSGAITTADLAASEPDAFATDLLYHVTNAVGGFVAAFDTPGTPILTFTQADVDAGQVVFSKDSTSEIGSFEVTVTDADGDVSEPVIVDVQSPNLAGSFKLADLDGTNGFRLNGINPGDLSGLAVSDAGDINGDGFDDILVGAPYADTPNNDAGETYVIFGAAGGFDADVDLSELDGVDGFRIDGTVTTDLSGRKLATAGDLNNDGIDDFLIGVSGADTNGAFNTGEVFVIYGDTAPFPISFSLTGFDGTDGTRILGVDFNSLTSEGLSEVGDFNGDGIDDIFIGAPFADSLNGSDAGEGYLIFGVDGGLGAEFALTSLNGTNGFRVDGEVAGGLTGITTGIGDVNNDGFDDIALSGGGADPLGRVNAGSTYVIFGSDAPFNAVEQVNNLNGANGFRVNGAAAGDMSGDAVSTAGDFNDDGIDDFIIGALGAGDAGAAYVIFGTESGFDATIDLGALDGVNGFAINGADAGDRFGVSVSDAGDFDGDGIGDLLISADQADPGAATTGGEAYILFGRSGSFTPSFDVASLDPADGFRIDSILPGDQLGRSISSAGDVNSDGRDDVILGAHAADPGGATSGQSYVIFGFGPNQPPIARDDAFDVLADTPIFGDLFADNGDDIDEDVDGDPFTLISVNGDAMQVGSPITLPSGASLVVQSDGLFDYASGGAFDVLADGETDADSFTYTIGNMAGEQSTATVNLTIIGVNDDPFAFDDNLTVSEDDDLVGSVFDDNGFGPDFDIDNGDVITVTTINNSRFDIGLPVTLAGGGQITLNDDGTFQFSTLNSYEALADGETATETFTYSIIDGFGGVATATANLEITGVNDAPVAQDDTFLTDEDTAIFGDLFADNGFGADTDIDSPTFTVTSINGVATNVGATIALSGLGGDLLVRADGTFDYSPGDGADVLAEGGLGAASFTYEITDGIGAVNTADVLITLAGLNDAPIVNSDNFSVSESDDLTGNLFDDNGNGPDLDVDLGDNFTITAINGVAANVGQQISLSEGGLITINDDGSFSFSNNNAYEMLAENDGTTENLTYTITDSEGANSTAILSLDIQGVNDLPEALDDDVSVTEGGVATFDVVSDNGNGVDFDIDNDQLTIVSANGQAVPSGGATNFFTTTGLAVTIDSTGALTLNAASPAFDALSDGEQLVDSFTYVLEDEFGGTDTAQVNVTINGVNDAPVANNDQFLVLANETLIFDPIVGDGAGGQDSDPEGAPLSIFTINGQEFSPGDVIALQSGANVAVSATGELEYRPSGAFDDLPPNQSTQDSFAYEIVDAGGLRAAAQVQIQIDAPALPPIAADDAVTAAEDGATTFNLFADNGAGPDQDLSGVELRLTGIEGAPIANGASVTLASGAVLTIDDAGLVAYTPGDGFASLAEGQIGSDSFLYTITDGVGLQDIGEVTVSITGENDAPIAANDLLRTDERTALTGNLFADNGAGPDTDADGGFVLTAVNGDAALVGSQIILASGAVVTVNADGSTSFDPNSAFITLNDGEEALEQLTYTIADELGATDEASVVFAVDGVTDTVFGTDGDDFIRGTDQADDIDGRGGNDLITGLAGNDTIKGGQGLDIIRGGADDDILIGGADRDKLFGEAGDDQLRGGGGDDRLLGLAGNDTISGNAGNDLVSGGAGADIVSGQSGNDILRGGGDTDLLNGGNGNDRLHGGGGADSLLGGAGADRLVGAGGADTLFGGDGDDLLFGRRGNDELTGGQGADRFIFNLGDGQDTITDFEQGADRIRIINGADDFSDLTIAQVGDDALITFGNVRILAQGEDANDFTNSDFIL